MRRIFLVRHGQTACSTRNVYCGACPTPLNENGQAMAQHLAAAMQNETWGGLYCSTLPRAQQMIAPLSALCGVPAQALRGLCELDYGRWDGRTAADIAAADPAEWAAFRANPAQCSPPDGETGATVVQRMAQVMTELHTLHPQQNVLLVSHKAAIRLILCHFLGIDLKYFRDRLAQPLGAVNVVEMRPNGPLLRSLADISYLPANLRNLTGSD